MARANTWLAFAVVAASGCAGDELAERSSSVTNCAEIFVDPANGSDSFDGCAASAGSNNSGPFRTLTAAGNYVAARRAAIARGCRADPAS